MKTENKNIRVRYKTNPHRPNEIESNVFIGQQDAQYKAKINTENLTYRIVNVRTQRIIRSTDKDKTRKANSLRYVKDQAKRALKSVGVNFSLEFRNLEV